MSSSIRLSLLPIYSFTPLKMDPFQNNTRLTLLGDAAHLMTPNRGMAANTAFADYEEKMCKRGFEAIRDSLASTRTTHIC
ncbi:unnamed protein product [Rotaria magnacalcarata]|uniref:FAD-binding domain-containing protein n=1 Tax=Rotaria magnacalcarata TaxID=392030 RepID=A0A816HDA7_9BILA|nr:unnamed protein product [Rotaria magnacalcarata]